MTTFVVAVVGACLMSAAPVAARPTGSAVIPVGPHTLVGSGGPVSTPGSATVTRAWAPSDPGTGAGPLDVIGPDGRVRVNPTTSWPARAIVEIAYTGGRCTGWLFSRDTVATAGHCVYDERANAWRAVAPMRVYPGRNGATTPYGSCGVRWSLSVAGWVERENPNFDYGFLRLDCTVGSRTGWLGYEWRNLGLVGTPVTVAGYPGDKPAYTQWRASGVVTGQSSGWLMYPVDTARGQSGAPVWTDRNRSGQACVCVLAVHAYGGIMTMRGKENAGVAITRDVFANFEAARARS